MTSKPTYRSTIPAKPGLNRRVEVQITAEIIESAVKADSSHCMIADAIKAQVPGAKFVSVDLQSIRFTDPKRGVRYLYLTPGIAQVALLRFDQGEDVEPFALKLPKPAQVAAVSTTKDPPELGDSGPGPRKRKPRTPKKVAGNGSVPTVIGGNLPPNGVLSNARGKRRTFGLRQVRP